MSKRPLAVLFAGLVATALVGRGEARRTTSGSQAFFNVTIVGKTPASLLGQGDIDAGEYRWWCRGAFAVDGGTTYQIGGPRHRRGQEDRL
jgi:hypothetical protein